MYHFKSDERIHIALTSESSEWNPQGLEALEAAAFEDAQWWSIDDLVAAKVQTLPNRLLEFLPDIIAGIFQLSQLIFHQPKTITDKKTLNIYDEFRSSRSAALTAYDKTIEGSKITHPAMRHASRSPTKGPSKSLKIG